MIKRLREIVLEVLEEKKVGLHDLRFSGKKLQVFIEKNGGTPLSLCTEISETLSDRLDREDIIQTKYRLEVSSPGVERKLIQLNDFVKSIGHRVYIGKTDEAIVGKIKEVEGSSILIETEFGEHKVYLSEIKDAPLKIRTKELFAKENI